MYAELVPISNSIELPEPSPSHSTTLLFMPLFPSFRKKYCPNESPRFVESLMYICLFRSSSAPGSVTRPESMLTDILLKSFLVCQVSNESLMYLTIGSPVYVRLESSVNFTSTPRLVMAKFL